MLTVYSTSIALEIGKSSRGGKKSVELSASHFVAQCERGVSYGETEGGAVPITGRLRCHSQSAARAPSQEERALLQPVERVQADEGELLRGGLRHHDEECGL